MVKEIYREDNNRQQFHTWLGQLRFFIFYFFIFIFCISLWYTSSLRKAATYRKKQNLRAKPLYKLAFLIAPHYLHNNNIKCKKNTSDPCEGLEAPKYEIRKKVRRVPNIPEQTKKVRRRLGWNRVKIYSMRHHMHGCNKY